MFLIDDWLLCYEDYKSDNQLIDDCDVWEVDIEVIALICILQTYELGFSRSYVTKNVTDMILSCIGIHVISCLSLSMCLSLNEFN